MPHVVLDYSANLEADADIAGLCAALRDAAAKCPALPEAGIRVRAFRADHCAVANGDPQNAYADISVRLRGGRDLQTRKQIAADLFAAARNHLAPVVASRRIALSLEVREIDPDPELSPKLNTIRQSPAPESSAPESVVRETEPSVRGTESAVRESETVVRESAGA